MTIRSQLELLLSIYDDWALPAISNLSSLLSDGHKTHNSQRSRTGGGSGGCGRRAHRRLRGRAAATARDRRSSAPSGRPHSSLTSLTPSPLHGGRAPIGVSAMPGLRKADSAQEANLAVVDCHREGRQWRLAAALRFSTPLLAQAEATPAGRTRWTGRAVLLAGLRHWPTLHVLPQTTSLPTQATARARTPFSPLVSFLNQVLETKKIEHQSYSCTSSSPDSNPSSTTKKSSTHGGILAESRGQSSAGITAEAEVRRGPAERSAVRGGSGWRRKEARHLGRARDGGCEAGQCTEQAVWPWRRRWQWRRPAQERGKGRRPAEIRDRHGGGYFGLFACSCDTHVPLAR
ncbi:unnamed protein product [Urochloa humidicola]